MTTARSESTRQHTEVSCRAMAAWLPAAAAAALALTLFAVTLRGSYLYDDQQIVLRDPRVIDPDNWREIWTKDYFNGGVDNLYRPLVTLTYAVQWQLHGDTPWVFHLVNWLLHAGVSAAVAELARRLSHGNVRVALIAGCLFAVHPIHTEVVANIVGRAESMCALAMLSAMILFLSKRRTVRRAIAIGVLGVAAMLSKEQGLLLPALLLGLHWTRQPKQSIYQAGITDAGPSERIPLLTLVLMMCWSVAIIVFLRENVLGLKFWWDRFFLDYTQNPLVLAAPRDQWLLPLVLLGRYTQLLIFPMRLSPDYGGVTIWHVARLGDPYLWLGVLAILTWLIAIIAAVVRKHRVMTFCLLSLALLYGLVGNIATIIGTIFAERLMYLPSVFFLIAVALALSTLRVKLLIPTLVVVVAVASVRTFTYAARWNDAVALYETSLDCYPGSVRLYFVLSEEYVRRGELEKAADTLARARQIMPDYAQVWFKSAVVSLRRGRFEEALQFARRAQAIDPRVTNNRIWDYIRDRQVLTEQ